MSAAEDDDEAPALRRTCDALRGELAAASEAARAAEAHACRTVEEVQRRSQEAQDECQRLHIELACAQDAEAEASGLVKEAEAREQQLRDEVRDLQIRLDSAAGIDPASGDGAPASAKAGTQAPSPDTCAQLEEQLRSSRTAETKAQQEIQQLQDELGAARLELELEEEARRGRGGAAGRELREELAGAAAEESGAAEACRDARLQAQRLQEQLTCTAAQGEDAAKAAAEVRDELGSSQRLCQQLRAELSAGQAEQPAAEAEGAAEAETSPTAQPADSDKLVAELAKLRRMVIEEQDRSAELQSSLFESIRAEREAKRAEQRAEREAKRAAKAGPGLERPADEADSEKRVLQECRELREQLAVATAAAPCAESSERREAEQLESMRAELARAEQAASEAQDAQKELTERCAEMEERLAAAEAPGRTRPTLEVPGTDPHEPAASASPGEGASQWQLEVADPQQQALGPVTPMSPGASGVAVALQELGFSDGQASAASRRCSSVEAAVEWLAANPGASS